MIDCHFTMRYTYFPKLRQIYVYEIILGSIKSVYNNTKLRLGIIYHVFFLLADGLIKDLPKQMKYVNGEKLKRQNFLLRSKFTFGHKS